jgi:hypothetical protein
MDYTVVHLCRSLEGGRVDARVAEEGEGRMGKPFLVEECEDAEGGVVAKRSGRWRLVPVGMDGEWGKSSIEGGGDAGCSGVRSRLI